MHYIGLDTLSRTRLLFSTLAVLHCPPNGMGWQFVLLWFSGLPALGKPVSAAASGGDAKGSHG